MLSEKALILLEKLSGILETGKFKILEQEELLTGTALSSPSELPLLIEELSDKGNIIAKNVHGEWCLSLTEKAAKTLAHAAAVAKALTLHAPKARDAAQPEAEVAQPAAQTGKSKKRVRAQSQGKISYIKVFLASLAGTLLGGGGVALLYHVITSNLAA